MKFSWTEILEFLLKSELIKRLFAETPGLFKLIRNIGLAAAFVAGVPALVFTFREQLCNWQEFACFDLPTWWNAVVAQITWITGLITSFVSQLTATNNAVSEKDIKQ